MRRFHKIEVFDNKYLKWNGHLGHNVYNFCSHWDMSIKYAVTVKLTNIRAMVWVDF